MLYSKCTFRSTPVELLHSILLGPYKYLLKVIVSRLTADEKRQILARMDAFNYSGFSGRVIGNLIAHHRSFVGRDYKAFAHGAVYSLDVFESRGEKNMARLVTHLSACCITCVIVQVFRIAYCVPFRGEDISAYNDICQEFVRAVNEEKPDMLKNPSIAPFTRLHEDFGPPALFNTGCMYSLCIIVMASFFKM